MTLLNLRVEAMVHASSGSGAGIAVGVIALLIVFLILGLALSIWWLIGLIEVVRVPDSAWRAADQNKIVAILLMVFLGTLGTIIYWLTMRPRLKAVGAFGAR